MLEDTTYQRHKSLGGLINVVAFNIRERFDQCLKQYNLDLSVWPVLVCLWEKDGIPQARIGEILGVPGYAMSRGVDRLEAAGLVIRCADPENRRLRRIYLTAAGRQIQTELAPLAAAINASILNLIDVQEQEILLTLLQKIVHSMTSPDLVAATLYNKQP